MPNKVIPISHSDKRSWQNKLNGLDSILFTNSYLPTVFLTYGHSYLPTVFLTYSQCGSLKTCFPGKNLSFEVNNWQFHWLLERINIVAAFRGMHVSPAKHSYAWLSRKCDYRTDRHTHAQTDAGQSDPYVPLCFAGDTIKWSRYWSTCTFVHIINFDEYTYWPGYSRRWRKLLSLLPGPQQVLLLIGLSSHFPAPWGASVYLWNP